MKLTSITDSFALRVARPTKDQKATFYFDKKSTGFGLKVYYNGTKVYGVRIAMVGNAARWLTIGPHGDPWDADGAREEARIIKLNVENGLDPFAHRAPKHASLRKFKDVAKAFFQYFKDEVEKDRRSQVTLTKYERQWERNVSTKLKELSVVSLKRSHFETLHKSISKRNPAKPTPVEANRTLAMLCSMFSWVLERDEEDRFGLKENLADGVSRNMEYERGIWMEEQDQARLLAFLTARHNRISVWWPAEWRARKEAKLAKTKRKPIKRPPNVLADIVLDAFLLAFLTGMRHCEVLALKWDDVSKVTGTLQVPISKRGGDPDAKAELKAVFITKEIQEVLDRIPKISEWVFPSQGKSKKSESGHLENLQDAWERIRKHLKLPAVRLHDFRHTWASELGDQSNLNARELKETMGWKTMQTAMRYMHARERQQQEKVQEISTSRIKRLQAVKARS
ncbi:site-specific integrase [Geothrix sp. 21YS21S-2]|uniref:site-specific integrase n=1 Tax=Geothrix sp. 21YS21S-2 TaxID=3068893 RepID=UPI0027B8D7F8|nr:site-specific integrase [Geothrix sp. 21YS21S-2]